MDFVGLTTENSRMRTPEKDKIVFLLEAIVAFIDEGVIVAEHDGRVLYHNPAASEMLGLPGNEPIGSLNDALGVDQHKDLEEVIARSARAPASAQKGSDSGNDFVLFQKRRRVRGELRELEFHCCRTGKTLGEMWLVIIRDVTERHRLEMLIDRSRGDLVTNDRKVLALVERVHQVAPSSASVLLQGESGTGKTHIARLVQRLSKRANKPFVEVNCAAIPSTLIESELFGHVKGAFTGATRDREGRFAAADGGTLFLDEIAEVPMHLQAKLLRAIQDQEFEPVGSDRTIRVDIRLITASNKDLRELVDAGKFRADLYYRLAVFTLQIPPIRERPGDIPLLLKHFCENLEQRGYPGDIVCSPEAMQMMMNYHWPGNVRELENAVEHAIICSVDKVVLPESLPEQIRNFSRAAQPTGDILQSPAGSRSAEREHEQNARREIEQALALARGNKSKAAKYLGVDRTTLWRRMQRLKLTTANRH